MSTEKILVTKSYLPNIETYKNYVESIWDRGHLTNQGPLVLKLEEDLKNFLNVRSFHFVSNGTIALQMALHVLDIQSGEIITTPFSYVATISSIVWQRCTPVFADIDTKNFCIDLNKIEQLITPETKAIMAVHVFGYPCDVEGIEQLAKKYNLKVIYDGAHAFGATLKGRALLDYGDISTCSFHATKLFHTIEGGCVIARDQSVSDNIGLVKSFGHIGDNHYCLGINAKSSEFHAAMGLCNIQDIDKIISERRAISELYDSLIGDIVYRPPIPEDFIYNYAYYPALFKSAPECTDVIEQLNQENIYPRRYFYPSLNTLPYIKTAQECPISEDIASRILCLPLYVGLEERHVRKIAGMIKKRA